MFYDLKEQQEGNTIGNRHQIGWPDLHIFSKLGFFSVSQLFLQRPCFTYHLLIYFWLRNLLGHESSNIRFFPWNTGNFPPELQASPCWATKSLHHRGGSYRQIFLVKCLGNIRGAIFCKAYSIIRSCKGSSSGILTYMNGWFRWEMEVNIPVPWILRVI